MEQVEKEISVQDVALKFREWRRYLWSYRLTILMSGILCALIAVGYAVYRKTNYTAVTTFVLEEDAAGGLGGGLGQYAGLAAMVGIDIGGSTSGIFQGDNITALYKSRAMIQKALLTEANFNGRWQLLIDHYVDFTGLREKWSKRSKFSGLRFTQVTGRPETRLADSLIGEIVEDINKKYLKVGKPDKKLNVISVEFVAEDELFAKVFNTTIVSTVNDFYIQTKTKKSLDNISVLQHQTDSVKAVMNNAISTAAKVVDVTPNLNITRQSQRTTPVQRSQFNAEANKAILTELVKNLELSKMNFLKEKPLIQVIDEPILPLQDDKPGKVKIGAFGFILGILLAIFTFMFTKVFKDSTSSV